MSFTGNLEDLGVVDVIQLLHSARKSGTLWVKCGKRDGQLVFSDGYIISANHSDASVQIGKILVEMKAISAETLKQALKDQHLAGPERKPLIGMLIESGQVAREKAFKGLEFLIEMTIVEMVSWARGTFTLDVDEISVSDEYRYFPETLNQDLVLDTQMVLMDALRIYDEMKRDGKIQENFEHEDETSPAALATVPAQAVKTAAPPAKTAAAGIAPAETADVPSIAVVREETPILSAADLGLDGIDRLETKIPEVFSGLQVFDPADIHRQVLARSVPSLPVEQREELADFLTELSSSISIDEVSHRNRQPRAVLVFSHDGLLRHALMTVCKHEGILVFLADSPDQLISRIEQSLAKGMFPLTVFEVPEDAEGVFSVAQIAALRQQLGSRYPHLKLIQLVSPNDDRHTGPAYRDGVKAVFPRPTSMAQPEVFAAEMVRFLETFRVFAVASFNEQGQQLFSRLNEQLDGLQGLHEIPAFALALLQSVAEQFPRALTLIVGKGELVVERGVGINSTSDTVTSPLGIKLSLDESSVFHRVIESGHLFFGPSADNLLLDQLFAAIGAPLRPHVLLLPLRSRGKTISLTYADFGADEPAPVVPDALEILARQAGLVLENALYRKQLVKAKP
jgi:Domain of unknown function (DUF4388)